MCSALRFIPTTCGTGVARERRVPSSPDKRGYRLGGQQAHFAGLPSNGQSFSVESGSSVDQVLDGGRDDVHQFMGRLRRHHGRHEIRAPLRNLSMLREEGLAPIQPNRACRLARFQNRESLKARFREFSEVL